MSQNIQYDDTKEFKNECFPHIVKIKQFCMDRGIPFYMTFATAETGKHTEYITAKQFPPECNVVLNDDIFRKIMLASHGFDLAMNHVDSFDMSDFPDDI